VNLKKKTVMTGVSCRKGPTHTGLERSSRLTNESHLRPRGGFSLFQAIQGEGHLGKSCKDPEAGVERRTGVPMGNPPWLRRWGMKRKKNKE